MHGSLFQWAPNSVPHSFVERHLFYCWLSVSSPESADPNRSASWRMGLYSGMVFQNMELSDFLTSGNSLKHNRILFLASPLVMNENLNMNRMTSTHFRTLNRENPHQASSSKSGSNRLIWQDQIPARAETSPVYRAISGKGVVLLTILLFACGLLNAQSVFTNPITGTNPSASSPYTTGQTVTSNLTASGIKRGTGITAATVANAYGASGWNSGSLNVNDYYEFTLTPSTCYSLSLSNFTYTSVLSAGTASYSFRSSIDNYAASIGTATATGTTISLSAAGFQNLTSAVTFRFYCWGASSAARTFSINDFTFTGSVTANTPSAGGTISGAASK